MLRKSQRRRNGAYHAQIPQPAKNSAQQSSATSLDQRNAMKAKTSQAKKVEQLVTPAFSFPFTSTYAGGLDLSDYTSSAQREAKTGYRPDTAGKDPYIKTQCGTLDDENRNQAYYLPVTRPWNVEFANEPQLSHNALDQSQLAFWEAEKPAEEPFNDIGEVALEPVDRV